MEPINPTCTVSSVTDSKQSAENVQKKDERIALLEMAFKKWPIDQRPAETFFRGDTVSYRDDNGLLTITRLSTISGYQMSYEGYRPANGDENKTTFDATATGEPVSVSFEYKGAENTKAVIYAEASLPFINRTNRVSQILQDDILQDDSEKPKN